MRQSGPGSGRHGRGSGGHGESSGGHGQSSGGHGRAAIVIFLLVLAGGGLVPLIASHRGRVTQPVAFNHLKHTQKLGLACEFCHKYVRTSAHSGLPDAATCAMCHSVKQGTSKEAAKVTELLAAGDSLQFHKLFHLASHVFYTHRRHVGIAGLACKNCHGDIATSQRPPERPLMPRKSSRRMQFCLDCHRKQRQSTDCTSCHR